MVAARERRPVLSIFKEEGMKMEWWYGEVLGSRRPSSGVAGGGGGGGGGAELRGDERGGAAAVASAAVASPDVPGSTLLALAAALASFLFSFFDPFSMA